MERVVKRKTLKDGCYLRVLFKPDFFIDKLRVASKGYVLEVGREGLWRLRHPAMFDRLTGTSVRGYLRLIRSFGDFNRIRLGGDEPDYRYVAE